MKTIMSKMRFTVLRIYELKVLPGGGEVVGGREGDEC